MFRSVHELESLLEETLTLPPGRRPVRPGCRKAAPLKEFQCGSDGLEASPFFLAGLKKLLLLAFCLAARAHSPGLSSAGLSVGDQTIQAVLVFNAKEVEALGSVESVARRSLSLALDGRPVAPDGVHARADGTNNVEFRLSFQHLPGRAIGIASPLLKELPSGHRQILEVYDSRGALIARELLSSERSTLIIAPSARVAAPALGFVGFLRLGIEHIATGYDHLLFLCGLLLVCDRFRSAVKIVSCFTIAHSITLAAATYHIVALSPRIIEPAIAASIIYVGVENLLLRSQVRGRGLLAFLFGLVHGLGFAGALREAGVGSGGSGIALPLAAFNLGVESGQLAIAAVLLPTIWRLNKRPAFPRVGVPACSSAIALAGAVWLFQRTVLGG